MVFNESQEYVFIAAGEDVFFLNLATGEETDFEDLKIKN